MKNQLRTDCIHCGGVLTSILSYTTTTFEDDSHNARTRKAYLTSTSEKCLACGEESIVFYNKGEKVYE